MTIQPVKNTPAPGYPEKSRRLAAPLAVGLTAAMALGLGACGERATMGVPPPVPTETCTVQDASATEFVVLGDMPMPVPETEQQEVSP